MSRLIRDYVRYPLEALGAFLFLGIFAVLPVNAASALGGWLGRTIGPRLAISRRALSNIARAMPETTPQRRREIVHAMWENLGRVAGEYPHIGRITRDAGKGGRVEIVGAEHLDAVRPDSVPGILFSGHFANWEVFALSVGACGVRYAQVYRAPSNPLVDRVLFRLRRLPTEKQIPKGTQGARMAIDILKHGGEVGMLVDQKMNDGIAVPFFGRDAMTAPAVAQLGLKFGCVVIPTRLERLRGCRFRVTFLPPMELPASGDRARDVHTAMERINTLLEGWIRERPEQWLWLYRRWPD